MAPKILEALTVAEAYMAKTENFTGKVRSLKMCGFIADLAFYDVKK